MEILFILIGLSLVVEFIAYFTVCKILRIKVLKIKIEVIKSDNTGFLNDGRIAVFL